MIKKPLKIIEIIIKVALLSPFKSGDNSRMEDKRFNVAVGHNNNTSSNSGPRARMSNPRINNSRGANPRVRNPVSSNRQHIHGQNKHKTNNRNKQGIISNNICSC